MPQQNATPGPGPANKSSGSAGNLSKVLVGSVVIGTCLTVAYSRGYLDDILGKKTAEFSRSLRGPWW